MVIDEFRKREPLASGEITLKPLSTLLLLLISCGEKPNDTGDTAVQTAETGTETAAPVDTSDSAKDTGDPSKETGDTASQDTGNPSVTFEITPSDEGVRYVGRWDLSAPDEPWAQWQGGLVEVSFEGTAISADLDGGSSHEYFRVIINDDQLGSQKFRVNSGRETYELASGLEWGVHKVQLVKETRRSNGATFYGFTGEGSGWWEAPAAPTRRMEFYGDSNLAGYSLESEENESASSLVGTHFTYAGITARMFGADWHNISISGATIGSLNGFYDQMKSSGGADWDFSEYTPDVVVINIGANDIYYRSENTIKSHYNDLLDDIRGHHPDAHIVLYNGWGWDYDEPADYTDEVVADRGDDNLSVATFPWVFEQWHGCETDHSGMAQYLAEHLEEVLGWTPAESDVVPGYLANGQVANGSFEELAPFGGFGWRYMSENGLDRVVDAKTAQEGNAYLSLTSGAETHQPNPADPGETVQISFWAKGESDSDTLDVTLDFRDQEMWTSPLQTETQTFSLTTAWQSFTVSGTAPSDGPRPVFHHRVTFQAGFGSTVSLDNVSGGQL